MPRRRYGACPGGSKVSYATRDDAKYGARAMARGMISRGILVHPVYSYTCPACRSYHLTRVQYRNGVANFPTYLPPPLEAQLWAMTPEHREALTRPKITEAYTRSADIERLPDPLPKPVKQPYANRPRGLRYR